ncbi:MAG: alpha/beta fold hydrolase [Bellilinea sp.]
MKPLRFFGFVIILVLLVILVGPLVIPIPPLPDPVPVQDLTDSDSRFIEVNSLQVHYKTYGSGEPVMVLLHGFASSTYTWNDVIPALSAVGTVIAYDRPAFGLTERPLPGEWTGDSPYSNESQVAMAVGLMDALGVDKAVLIGHSAGAAIALQTALEYPERVRGLVLVDPAVSSRSGIPGWAEPLINTPHFQRLGPYLSRSLAGKEGDAFLEAAWYDTSKFTEEDKAAYREPLQVENWDAALWEFTLSNRGTDLESRLGEVNQPVLVLSGDHDRIVPPEISEKIAAELPNARYGTMTACGHVPQEECPEEFLPPVLEFISRLFP